MTTSAHRPRILVVEDEGIVARDIQLRLQELGYDPVGHAARGEDAVSMARDLRPDLVLMDIRLAGAMDGIATAAAIRAECAVPVVFLTAFAEDDELERAKRTDPFGYIIKPFSERELHAGLEMALFKHQAEARLRESAENYRLLFDSMLDGFAVHEVICDSAGVPVDYRFLAINPAFARMTGLRAAEVIGRTMLEVMPDTDPVWVERYGRVALTGEGEHFEEFSSALQRHYEVAVFRPKPGQCATVFVDISERKRSAELLRQSDIMARTLFEQAGDGVVSLSATDLSILSANESFARMHGYTVPEVLAMSIRDLAVPDATQRAAGRVARLIAGDVLKFEVEHYHKDGHVFPVEVTANLVDIDGQRLILAFHRDTTERRSAQAETAALEAQLQHAQKMESVGRLAGGVAHDFNNMLVVILGTTEVALEQVGADEPLHADLEEIQRAARRSADLTRQLLSYARRETIAPEELDLNETVPGLLSMLQRLLGEDVRLLWAPATTLWPIIMDPSQLANVLTNLCVNARDAIADVGTIAIATENRTLDAAFCARHGDATPGDFVRLTVRDTGCGMDEFLMAQIFEPFFTTKGEGKGTGLGLASVYGAVRQNHGFVAVSSIVGEGTTFHIYLPRLVGAVGAEQRATRETAAAARGQETILLVEDEPALLKLAARLLERQGYHVLTAGSPADAVRVATQHDGEIALLLTDVVMPGMNGRDLAQSLQALRPQLRPLFMSGHTAGVITERGILLDGAAFLEKPFSTQALAAKVRAVLDARDPLHPDSGRVA